MPDFVITYGVHFIVMQSSIILKLLKQRNFLLLTAVPVPKQPAKAKVLKARKNVRKNTAASNRSAGAGPPLKQRRLGCKPVTGTLVQPRTAGQRASSSSHTDTAAVECPVTSPTPSSSQVNSFFTDRLGNIQMPINSVLLIARLLCVLISECIQFIFTRKS